VQWRATLVSLPKGGKEKRKEKTKDKK